MRRKLKTMISGIIAIATIAGSMAMPITVGADTVEQPSDLHFRKFYTGRNFFDSELPITELDLKSVADEEAGSQYEEGKLLLKNSDQETAEYEYLLGKMKPYSVYDLSITEQTAASMAGITWERNDDNWISLTRAAVSNSDAEIKPVAYLDMQDADLLNKHEVSSETTPSCNIEKVTNSVKVTSKGTSRGESYLHVGEVTQNSYIDVTVSEQVNQNYTANAIVRLRTPSDSGATQGVFVAQRKNGTLTAEVFVEGTSMKNVVISDQAVDAPYDLRVAVDGNQVHITRIKDGVVTANGTVDLSGIYDLTDSEVLSTFEYVIGARLDPNESVTYTKAEIYQEEQADFPDSDEGFLLQVEKNGASVMDKVLYYPQEANVEEPFTLRAHWIAEYLSVWFVQGGKPYLMGTEYLGDYFDMRDEAVFPFFDTYLKTTLTPGAELKISEFRNYYTGGTGQADPKPLHYKDGTVMVEDGKMWLSMTLRGYQALPASCQGIYSLDLETYELELVNVTAFRKAGENLQRAYCASDFCYDEDTGEWLVITSSHGDDKYLRAGILPSDPRTTDYMVVDVDVMTYSAGTRTDYEDPSLIYDEAAGKWRLATCFSGNGGFNVGLLEADNFNGPYTEIAAYTTGSCTGNLIQKIGEEYYVFTGRSPQYGNGPGMMNLEVLNYPEMTKNTSLNVDGQTDSYNPWPAVIPMENEKGETVYRLISFDRDSIVTNDGSMATGQYSYGRVYLYEAIEKYNSKDVVAEKPEIAASNVKVITNADELWAISENLSGKYTLGADIDLSDRQWYPIGTEAKPFTGTFDGNGYTITGLTSENTSGMEGVGLFGYTSKNAVIKNVTLLNGTVSGRIYTGILAGYNNGTISNCAVSGTATGESEVGLIAGRNTGTIEKCSVTGTVNGTGNDSAGGLIGANVEGTVSLCRAEIDVTGTINVGGLVGYNDRAMILNSYASGTVTGKNYVGGLAGASGGSGSDMLCRIRYCYADSVVSGNTAGTLVGFNDKDIADSFATGSVNGESIVGGLVGRNNQYGNVENAYTDSKVSGTEYVGALFGKNRGDFTTAASTGELVAVGNSPDTVISDEVPDFTAAETYLTGQLKGWNKTVWNVENGLPELIAVAKMPENPSKPVLPFEDVTEADWFYEAVYYNYFEKLMTGMDATHFGPYGQLSRAQFALILFRMEGEEPVETDKSFGDITGNEWYGPAVLWAAENGIVTGYQDGNFGPADMITREQMAVMMYRYAFYISQCEAHPFRDAGTVKYLGEDMSTTAEFDAFKDAASVSPFATDAVAWAVGSGIITGKEQGTVLDPQGNTARSECAVIIQRFMQ